MSLGANSANANTGGHPPGPIPGALPPNQSGLPNVAQMDPQAYIDRLLTESGVGAPPSQDFFSLSDGSSSHGGGHSSSDRNQLIKWGVAILAGIALWKIALSRTVGNAIRNVATKIRGWIKPEPQL